MKAGTRIGYVPYSADLTSPADRRRLPFWSARREIPIEIVQPGERYDVVVLAGTADIAAWARHPHDDTKIIYELIDSYLALPRLTPRSLLRGLAKFAAGETSRPIVDYQTALERMCRRADVVVCSTPEQRAQLLSYCPEVQIILDAHVDLVTTRKTEYGTDGTIDLVWEGQPHTLDDFLVITEALEAVAREHPIALHLVTDLEYAAYAGRFVKRHTTKLAKRVFHPSYLYQWNPRLLADIVTSCDVGLIPLDLADAFARGKPENKLLLLWSLGMPVATSRSPAYERVMTSAGLDLTCRTLDDWVATLTSLVTSEALRQRAAENGLEYLRREHSVEGLLARWDRLFDTVLSS